MTVVDTVRIETALMIYGFWMDLRGTPGPRRRELRRELRANLRDAAAEVGTGTALDRLGGTRRLAAEIDLDPGAHASP